MAGPRVGYVGLDHHHCEPYLRTLGETTARVTCACEPNPAFDPEGVETLGEVPVYATPEALFEAEDVDVAWITLSNRDTPGAILTALDHGVDVFTEKPAARTAADLEPVISAADASAATVCVAYAWRGHPVLRELRRRVRDGSFGDVRSFAARYLASSITHRDTDHYLFDPEQSRGGILQWLGVHWLDALPWVFDDPITAVNASTVSHDGLDVEDGATLQCRTASGAIGTLRTGYALGEERYDTHIAIEGTEATGRWDPTGERFGFEGTTTLEIEPVTKTSRKPALNDVTHEYEPVPGYGGEWGLAFVRQFFAARTGDAEVPATIRDAHRVLRVLDAAYEAASTDRWVAIDGADARTATAPAGELRQQ